MLNLEKNNVHLKINNKNFKIMILIKDFIYYIYKLIIYHYYLKILLRFTQ